MLSNSYLDCISIIRPLNYLRTMFHSVWVTGGVMRCSLSFCSRRSPWKQRRFLLTTSIKDTQRQTLPSQQLAHSWGTKQSQTRLTKSFVSSVRFCSQENNHREELEEKHLSFPVLSSGPRQGTSPFMDHLQRCGSTSDVLDLTCQISPTVQQVSNCLFQMWTITKKMSDKQQRYEVQMMFEHPAFEKLLQKAMKNVVYMQSQDIPYSLLSMVKLGVPQSSRVVQTFLRNCQVDCQPASKDVFTLAVFLFCCFSIYICSLTGETK